MKTVLLLSSVLCLSSSILFAADYFRTDNPDTDWANLENWATDETGSTPAEALPSAADTINFGSAAEGTSTVFDSDNLTLTRINSSANVSLEFSGINANISNRFQLSSSAGDSSNYKTTTLTLSNAASVTTWMFYGTSASYTNLLFNITGNSTFTATSATWNHFQLVQANDTSATLNIEEGSSLLVGANFAVNGTHNLAQRSKAIVNVYGNLQSNGLYVGDGTNSEGTVNLYGTASCLISAGVELKSASSSLNFVLKDISEARVSTVTDGNADWINDAILQVSNVGTSGVVFGTLAGTVNVDLQDFSMGEFVSWNVGETYAISLISVADESWIFDTSFINIINADKMGSWSLASENRDEYLKWDGTTLNLYVTAVPEPSAYAMLFGVFALGFAFHRKTKRN